MVNHHVWLLSLSWVYFIIIVGFVISRDFLPFVSTCFQWSVNPAGWFYSKPSDMPRQKSVWLAESSAWIMKSYEIRIFWLLKLPTIIQSKSRESRSRLFPNVVTYNSLLGCPNKPWFLALRLLQILQMEGIRPDIISNWLDFFFCPYVFLVLFSRLSSKIVTYCYFGSMIQERFFSQSSRRLQYYVFQ